ncbi:hypothetical protein IQ251_15595 [Saccharopolyspora sp. HNM0983]|uniref:SCP2 domain-containing protein n=1 Tax=Saccharopolyspora montiporae TaxID=2781240 RepID=A0A929B9R7_9PSEU|nr:hypothetical protein [Saccharopolyspora sp. HNM0983]MBE9375874.1 hypothetical protein [Saccharopolyspora sp. HNM0983]
MSVELFTPRWAGLAREAVQRGPDETVRAGKLDTYWDWIERVRGEHSASWALGMHRATGTSYLRLQWKSGTCTSGEIRRSPAADYVLAAEPAVWRELLDGADPGRLLMYRRMRLVEGDVLLFFRAVYFVVESLAAVARIPAVLPEQE